MSILALGAMPKQQQQQHYVGVASSNMDPKLKNLVRRTKKKDKSARIDTREMSVEIHGDFT